MQTKAFGLLGSIPRSNLLNHMVGTWLVLQKYFQTDFLRGWTSKWERLPTISSIWCLVSVLNVSCSYGYTVVPHYCFQLIFPEAHGVEHLFLCILSICVYAVCTVCMLVYIVCNIYVQAAYLWDVHAHMCRYMYTMYVHVYMMYVCIQTCVLVK